MQSNATVDCLRRHEMGRYVIEVWNAWQERAYALTLTLTLTLTPTRTRTLTLTLTLTRPLNLPPRCGIALASRLLGTTGLL